MVFSSVLFIFLFLPITLILYLFAGRKLRNLLLLSASLFFYAWGEKFFVLLMLCSICANYIFGLLIEKSRGEKASKIFLIIILLINLGLLSIFKYLNFIVNNINVLTASFDLPPIELGDVHLPIGISFFTFQAITYVVDVYKHKVSAQKNPIHVALYISLFFQLIAGPIVRYRDIARQITNRSMSLSSFSYGIERFIFGFGKKILIANPLSEVTDQIFSCSGDHLTTGVAWFGAACYTLQIYFDFSGYSDMAIGLGRMFGFKILENFNYPYISKSVQEFWRRWHISLSNWFRDYLYIPLGGNRKGPARTYFNLIVVFFLCGLWHGASWNFIVWGMCHGAFLVIERIGFSKILEGFWQPLRHIYVILFIMISWVFFRAESLAGAYSYLSVMFGFHNGNLYTPALLLNINKVVLISFVAGLIFSMPVLQVFGIVSETQKDENEPVGKRGVSIYPVYGFVLLVIFMASILRLSAGAYNPFIYFRF